MPTLVVWGTDDGVIPASHAPLLKGAMPQARLELFDGAGHSPHRSDPERFVALLRDFVATTEPARYDPERWTALLRRGRPDRPDDRVILANARAEAEARAKALAAEAAGAGRLGGRADRQAAVASCERELEDMLGPGDTTDSLATSGT
jgi:hypothetical protein